MKVKLLKKIRKRFSIYEIIHLRGKDDEHSGYRLYDGNKEISSSCFKSHCIYRILEITRKQYVKYSKHYKFKGKKVWYDK